MRTRSELNLRVQVHLLDYFVINNFESTAEFGGALGGFQYIGHLPIIQAHAEYSRFNQNLRKNKQKIKYYNHSPNLIWMILEYTCILQHQDSITEA
jgi:hypothetical protein